MQQDDSITGPAPIAQWVGLLLAPATFFVHLQMGYVLVLWACSRPGGMVWVHLAGALSVLLAAVGVVAAWLTWVRAGRDAPGEELGAAPRTRLMGISGLGVSALLSLLLLVQWVQVFFVPQCQ